MNVYDDDDDEEGESLGRDWRQYIGRILGGSFPKGSLPKRFLGILREGAGSGKVPQNQGRRSRLGEGAGGTTLPVSGVSFNVEDLTCVV